MAVYLSPVGNGFQFFDSNGKPLNAGLINVYAAGTTTPINSYTTSLGNVANANPIVLGADGRVNTEIWFTQGTAYKFLITDSLANTIITLDNLWGINDPQFGQQWAIAGGTADAITAAYTPPNTALIDGQLLYFRAIAANATTTPTFSPDGLTARTITKYGGSALSPGDISANLAECILRYNLANTRWELLNPAVPSTGTWTPSVGGTATYTSQVGTYVKVGKWVSVQCHMVINAIGSGSTTTISGLPFTASSAFSQIQTGAVSYFASLATNVLFIAAYISTNTTTVKFVNLNAAGAATSLDPAIFGNSAEINFSMTYEATA